MPAINLFFGASEKSLGNELTESCHVLVEGGPPWPLAEQILEPTTRRTATEQRTKSGKERGRVGHACISIYTSQSQAFSMKNPLLSPTQIAALRKRFEHCKTQILALDWVTQGSLSQSPQGNWRWTRKVKAKTVTVALSDQQAELFHRAVDDHRKLEKLIDQMRTISQQVLLNSVEGPTRRKRRISS